jgi:hypothetical protein
MRTYDPIARFAGMLGGEDQLDCYIGQQSIAEPQGP